MKFDVFYDTSIKSHTLTIPLCAAEVGCLMEPNLEVPYRALLSALEDMQMLQEKATEARELMRDMLRSRQSIAELSTDFDIRYVV